MKNKKINGHLRLKRGIWQIVLTWKDENGKQCSKSTSTRLPEKGNKTKAKHMLEEAKAEFIPPVTVNSKSRFSNVFKNWLKSIEKNIEDNTYGSYQVNARKIVEYFESDVINCPSMDLITKEDITRYYDYLFSKGLTGNTVGHYHTVLSMAFRWAYENTVIDKNPMLEIKKPKTEKFIGEFLNSDEVNKLFEIVKGKRIELAVMLAVFYGLRRSEILGLKWSAIDFVSNTMTIKQTVVVVNKNNKSEIASKSKTKNESSLRTFPLVPEFRNLLLRLQEKQKSYRQLCGKSYNLKYIDYVYVNELGELIKPNYITQNFKLTLEQNNFRHIRFHDLRHTCASLLINNNVSLKEIQEYLGHSTLSTTANFYTHLELDNKAKLTATMQNIGIKIG